MFRHLWINSWICSDALVWDLVFLNFGSFVQLAKQKLFFTKSLTSLSADFQNELQTKQLKFDGGHFLKMNKKIFARLLERMKTLQNFKFNKRCLQRFFFPYKRFMPKKIAAIEFRLFCLKLVLEFGKEWRQKFFVKNNFCCASWTNKPKFKKLKFKKFRL
jgi:hypothetical protein